MLSPRTFVSLLLLSSADAFTAPASKAVAPAGKLSARSPAIAMRGWQDPYKDAGIKVDKSLKVKGTSFDDEMNAINDNNNKLLAGGLFAMIAVIAVLVGTTTLQAGVLD